MLKAKKRLGLVFFPAFDWQISPTHPEREERLLYTMDQLKEEGIFDIDGIELFNPVIATEKDINRVHFCYPDVNTKVPKSHLISAGGAIRAAEAVLNNETEKSFAIVRPPGHHAHRIVYGDRGFCIINIEAVMVEYIRKKYGNKKIAIIDTDCHHGDGTQDIYWNDKDTLFISLHQDGRTLFPGSGFQDELGGPGAFGYNLNIPLPPNTGEEGFLYVLDNLILPILEEYKPDIIINSAGQDNHYTDPITNMNFTAQGYGKLNEKLNPDIAVLEGGYSIEGALPYINLGIILAMAGLDYSKVKEPDYTPEKVSQSEEITKYIKRLCSDIYSNWKNREALAEKLFKDKEYVIRNKRIYYDTDGIMENQEEKIKVCSSCSGLIIIKSKSDRGDKLLAIIIPRDGCDSCINKGYELYKTTQKGKFSKIYLQDKVNDEFFSKI
ncbi:histone deacetylase family protein [Thermohalobacter berrensis]|uniref:Histone deacetylase n=1 Tax=Thermohalobacter berrensis TaxID=99594 RepID=A0A419SWD1_9FIRM|nr:histone deacetylase [Thermohalobacter berrensis]RKD29511.1 histone deacetylase [Thermohalobacter berrensis]